MTKEKSQLSLDPQRALFEKTGHRFIVEFENGHKGGWMFWSNKCAKQRLGLNYAQAKDFINNFDWEWIREHPAVIKNNPKQKRRTRCDTKSNL